MRRAGAVPNGTPMAKKSPGKGAPGDFFFINYFIIWGNELVLFLALLLGNAYANYSDNCNYYDYDYNNYDWANAAF